MAMVVPRALLPGSRIGPYELTRYLGEGGFAEVWLAGRADDASAPVVAVKVVRRGRVANAADRVMFLDEANIAASIRHPNVARVIEIGEEESSPYLVMEYVAGGTLERVVRGARAAGEETPIGMAVALVGQTCAGLHAAHELVVDGRAQGVVHRDVSPENILLTEEGVPKVIDFGIAKARERIQKATSTGVAKGKVAYMSPEQARGEALDRRADIWAIGAVAYELLEGRRVLEGPNEIARLQQLVSRPVRLVFTRTPDRVAAVVRRALSFRARDRQPTAEALRVELEDAIAAEGLGTSSEAIEAFCRRARDAADEAERTPIATTEQAPEDELRHLLDAAKAEATVSVVDVRAPPMSPSRALRMARARVAAIAIVGGLAAVVLGGLAVRHGAGVAAGSTPTEARPIPPALPRDPGAAALLEPPVPEPRPTNPVASTGPSPAADPSRPSPRAAGAATVLSPVSAKTAPSTSAPPRGPAKPALRSTRRPADYDQIE